MNILKSISGTYNVKITCASFTDILTSISKSEIPLYDVRYMDELTLCAVIDRCQFNRLQELLILKGATVEVLQRRGIFWTFWELRRRPVLIFGLLVFLFLSFYVPSRVFFVNIDGNDIVPTKLILEKAQLCGIDFGASRREVRSEKMKNALLEAIPQLQWAGINTSGCTAIISVRERSNTESSQDVKPISSIVAKTDGVISDITVLRGTPLCKVGQAVKSGQVLVSGYTDCGLVVKAESAEAEILAQTRRIFTSVTPTDFYKRVVPLRTERNFRLLIGKKLLNFTKDSGISGAGCVKMYKEYYLMLPGGFQLPVALIVEEINHYSLVTCAEENNFDWIEQLSENYVISQILAGKIIHSKTMISSASGLCVAKNEYDCIEMIGQVRIEEIFDDNGEGN